MYITKRATQREARYTPEGGIERCSYCRHFVSQGTCNRIIGPVSPRGWCMFFSQQVTYSLLDPGGMVPPPGVASLTPTTWNPADLTLATLTGSNLIATTSGTGGGVRGIASLTSGKYYWECTYTTINTNSILVGIAVASASLGTPSTGTAYIGRSAGTIFSNGVNSGTTLGIINTGNVICIAVDFTGHLIWFRNGGAGNWNNNSSNNPATGVGGISISAASTGPLFPLMSGGTSDRITANFGGSTFAGVVPSGFTGGFET